MTARIVANDPDGGRYLVKIDSEQKPTWVEANYVDDVPKYIASRALAGRLVAAYGAAEGFRAMAARRR